MSKHIEVNELLDFYDCLLTDTQQKIMNYYFKNDLSLSEIAELLNISRSAVSDALGKSQDNLNKYEEKLGLIKKHHQRLKFFKDYPSEVNDMLLEIEKGEKNV